MQAFTIKKMEVLREFDNDQTSNSTIVFYNILTFTSFSKIES